MRELATWIGMVGGAGAMLVAGCFVDAGLDDCDKYPAPGCVSGTGGATSSTASTGGTTSTSMGGSGGTTSSSSTGTVCKPNEETGCYSGPINTLSVGICKGGTKVCNADGTDWGPCMGEVLPAPMDDCATAPDENCDGTPNEICPCAPSTTRPCYSGPAATEGVGACQGGTQTCNAGGTGWGQCVGEQTPLPEDCTTPVDEDCDGKVFDDTDDGCVCDPSSAAVDCYTGPAGTMGVGLCVGGKLSCNPDGKGMSGCVGQIIPTPEVCATAVDEDCDGKAFNDSDDGCVCQPGTTQACATGMVGICTNGNKTCSADGKGYGACTPDTPATTENCGTVGTDESCDGDSTCNGGALIGKVKGTSAKEDFAYGVAFDPAGNFVAGGAVGATFTSGALTAGSLWLGKYTALTGNLTWEKTATPTGSGAYAVVNSVATDGAGNVFAGGEFKGTLVIGGTTLVSDTSGGGVDAILMKLDPNGNVVWVKSFGSTSLQTIASVAVDGGGNVFIAGSMAGTANFGGGVLTAGGLSYDAFVAKLNTNGGHVWSRNAGDSGDQYALGAAATPGGDVILVGSFHNHLNFGTDMDAGSDADAFVIRLQGANGNEVWAKQFGDNSDQGTYAVAVDTQNNAVVTGRFDGSINFGGGNVASGPGQDIFVAKLSVASGGHLWSKGFGGADDQNAYGVAVDGLGNVVVTGSFESDINFGGGTLINPSASTEDVYVAKLAGADGAHIWSKSYGDVSNGQLGCAVAVDKTGNVAVAGGFRGTMDLGVPVGVLTSAGALDLFVVKLKP